MKRIESLHYITRPLPNGFLMEQIEQVCKLGVRWVQLRIKNVSFDDWVKIAQEARRITHRWHATLIINDSVQVALACGADGVHLGMTDDSPAQAKQLLGHEKIIGLSAHNAEEITHMLSYAPDYLSIGPFRKTNTKADLAPVLGLDGIKALAVLAQKQEPRLPLIAIGGIRPDDVPALLHCGFKGIAVSSAFRFDGSDEMTMKKFDMYLSKKLLLAQQD
ncbi:MAG: thiamine phosphate synthase [Chitinophagales bacterium]|nr:thiamine phosphate synthase [Chitinophagales bacterium]MDW8428381.1 thiamine phosphate synthase [Chitinophagales bacterium]